MAGSNRRFTFAAIALPFLFLVMAGLARATDIVVNTTDGETPDAPLCSLPDAITAHNITSPVHGCSAGSGNDRIFFAVTGTILIDETLEIVNGTLSINGPIFGCSGAGPCGITIDGEGTVQIIRADLGTSLSVNALTFNHGFATGTLAPGEGGGAISAHGNDLEIHDCLFVNNKAQGPTSSIGGEGGAIYSGVVGKVVIVNSTFANNIAEPPTAMGVTISSSGGAIDNDGDNLELINCTFSGNSADFAAGVFFEGPGVTKFKNTILANNTGGNCSGPPVDFGSNISSDDTCAFATAPFFNNTDPLLDPMGLKNNGGPTETIALETGSPAIDLVSLVECVDQNGTPLATDQRLFGRPDPANLNACDSGAYEVGAVAPIVLATGTEKVQIARDPNTANSDKVNIGLTFIYNGDPDCDVGLYGDEDALNNGFGIALVEGTCASLPASGLFVTLNTFVVHTVNHESYGTLFETSGPAQASARLLALPTPPGVCGEWTLNLEVSGLDTPAFGLGGGNPFAILISDLNDATQCFDVTNAIVGQQIPTPPPPAHSVRHRVRRQVRR